MRLLLIFRLLIGSSVFFGFASGAFDLIVPLDEPAKTMSDQLFAKSFGDVEAEGMAVPLLLLGIMLVCFPLAILGIVGMILLKSWGRALSLWTSLLTLPLFPLMGPMIVSGSANLLTYCSAAAWGAALAMAYWSPVSEHFLSEQSTPTGGA